MLLATPERGVSHAGYHHPGCARPSALIGKAFAEANPEMMKKEWNQNDSILQNRQSLSSLKPV
jgi:hypothetical protein